MERPSTSWGSMLKAALVLALSLSAVTIVATDAIFTDSEAIGANAFTTGTIDLSVAPATAAVTFSHMLPGDAVTQPITVSNAGTVAYRYSVTSEADDTDTLGLAAQLDLTIKTGVTTCTNGGFATDGAVVYGAADLGSETGIDVIGDPSQGADAGDRTLAASANEVLCVQVSLPIATGNAYQGAATTAQFTFDAEQVANNP